MPPCPHRSSSSYVKSRTSSSSLPLPLPPPTNKEWIPTTATATTPSSSEPLVHTTESFIESAWNGSMCEKELGGRKVPLAFAIQRSTTILDASLTKLGKKFPVLYKDDMGDKFSILHFRKKCRVSLKLIKKMDFAVMGTSNYELVRRALDMFKESWLNGPLHAEVYVIQKFCERILNVLDLLEKITGSRIANDIGWHGEVTTLSEREAVPDSLQQLVLKMEAFEDPSVSTNLARFARALIDAAWSGRMCEKQLGRKIPLAVAIRRSVSVLIDAMKSYIDKFTDVFSDNEVVEGNFDAVKFRNNALDTAEKLKLLDLSGFGIVAYEEIKIALFMHTWAWKEGPLKDEVFVVMQFCERMSKLLQSTKEKVGRDIANAD